jgi:hypothetical protein
LAIRKRKRKGARGGLAATAIACGLCGLGSLGCADDPAPPAICVDQPSFRLEIAAPHEPLPEDTAVRIAHGAGCEQYTLGQSGTAALPCVAGDPAGVLFCAPLPTAAPNDAAGEGGASDQTAQVSALRCEVWSDGAATLTVTSKGYVPVERQLQADVDDCGAKTVNVAVELELLDAATSQ